MACLPSTNQKWVNTSTNTPCFRKITAPTPDQEHADCSLVTCKKRWTSYRTAAISAQRRLFGKQLVQIIARFSNWRGTMTKHQHRVFENVTNGRQKSSCQRVINDATVAGRCHRNNGDRWDSVVIIDFHHSSRCTDSKNAGLRRIDDGRERLDVKHTQVGNTGNETIRESKKTSLNWNLAVRLQILFMNGEKRHAPLLKLIV